MDALKVYLYAYNLASDTIYILYPHAEIFSLMLSSVYYRRKLKRFVWQFHLLSEFLSTGYWKELKEVWDLKSDPVPCKTGSLPFDALL